MKSQNALLDLINDLEGVVTSIYADAKGQHLDFRGEPNFQTDKLKQIISTGFSLFKDLQQDQPDSQEIRLDLEDFHLVYHRTDAGELLALFTDKNCDLDAISAGIQGFTHMPLQWIEKAAHVSCSSDQTESQEAIIDSSRYTNEELIGTGGTALVYRAYDTVLNREVALKRYTSTSGDQEDYRSELQSASLIKHHNVVSTYDAGEDSKGRFMVMELIEGQDLQLLIEKSPLSLDKFNLVARQALEAMSATHKGGLLHLDIKPANIMLTTEGQEKDHLKLIDYGRAQALPKNNNRCEGPRGSGLSGSIYFSSPEALKEETLDPRADLYSLGCVFYWILSGRRPFEGETALAIMAAHLQHIVPDLSNLAPHVPRRLSTWIMSLVKEDPNMRPQSADEALFTLMKRGFA